jgi:hypothetical protein
MRTSNFAEVEGAEDILTEEEESNRRRENISLTETS